MITTNDKATDIADSAVYHLDPGDSCFVVVLDDRGDGSWGLAKRNNVDKEKLLEYLQKVVATISTSEEWQSL